MSTKERYFDSLDDSGRQRYVDKQFLLSLSVENDTYAAINSKTFVRDMSLWPLVEFGHVLCFFLLITFVVSKSRHCTLPMPA